MRAFTASFYYLLELGALDCAEDVGDQLAIDTFSVALVGQVPEGGCGGLGQLKHALNGEALDLRHCGH